MKSSSKTRKTKSVKSTPNSNIFINDNFLKIRPLEGGVSYIPVVDVRYVDAREYFNNSEKKDKKDTCWRLHYSMIDGIENVDSTPFKTLIQAEKIADSIVAKLPAPKPITTIQQPIPVNNTNDNYDDTVVGEQPHFGFIGNPDDTSQEE